MKRKVTKAEADVLGERARQVEKEGWSYEHDDQYDTGQLRRAALSYMTPDCDKLEKPPGLWPWADHWWRPKDYRTNLVKAGALIIAELERLDREEERDRKNENS